MGDCSGPKGNMGCDGGLMDQAFNYTVINKGIDTEASYAYTAMDGTCKFNASNVGATIKSWTDVSSGSEPDLQKAVATVGPVSVAIDASQYTFQLYAGGVYHDDNCSSQFLDHGVLAGEEQLGYRLGHQGIHQDVPEQQQQLWYCYVGLLPRCLNSRDKRIFETQYLIFISNC